MHTSHVKITSYANLKFKYEHFDKYILRVQRYRVKAKQTDFYPGICVVSKVNTSTNR